eukprot:UC1_evm1s1847
MSGFGGDIRAFELVPIINQLVSSKSKTEVTALECWEDNLWIGTSDGWVVYYVLEAGVSPTGKLTYRCGLQKNMRVSAERPVERIMAAPKQQKLLVLCDGRLQMLQAHTLRVVEDHRPVRNVSLFCRNEGNDLATSDTFEVSVANRKKGVYQYEFAGNVLVPHKDLQDLEGSDYQDVQAMSRDNVWLVLAMRGSYTIHNLRKGTDTALFQYDPAVARPIVKRLSSDEFLLCVAMEGECLGMFITTSGVSSRPPVTWVSPPAHVVYQFPYVLGLDTRTELITVHSVLFDWDQQQQQLPNQIHMFKNGVLLNDTNGQVFVAAKDSVKLLAPISFETQINDLLGASRVSEALTLAKFVYGKEDADLDAEERERQVSRIRAIHRRAGFAFLRERQFVQAMEMFTESTTDPREVLALFPDIELPAGGPSSKVGAGEHGIKSIVELTKGSPEALRLAQEALVTYLESVRHSTSLHRDSLTACDTALVQVLGVLGAPRLTEVLSGPNRADADACLSLLSRSNCHNAMAMLYAQGDRPMQALDVWRKLDAGELHDAMYPGVSLVVDFLVGLQDEDAERLRDIVFKNAPWILRRDPAGVCIFTSRPIAESRSLFRPDEVLDCLRPLPQASLAYLEYLVLELGDTSQRHHTQLVMIYLDIVLRKRLELENKRKQLGHADDTELNSRRRKLQRLLLASDHYRVEMLLERLRDTDLHQECAVVYGKLGEHEKALDLLVHRLGDHRAAERYCHDATTGKPRAERQRLFLSLLKVYLNSGGGKKRGGQDYQQQALELLSSEIVDLDIADVLKIVPPHWGVQAVSGFLRRGIRRDVHARRSLRVQRGLAQSLHVQCSVERANLRGRRVVIRESSRCEVCDALLHRGGEAVVPFVVYPNSVIACKRCARDLHVCPVTGERFKKSDSDEDGASAGTGTAIGRHSAGR